ncbi:MAG: PaaI family thioesterase [Gemmatimonadales bacterium]
MSDAQRLAERVVSGMLARDEFSRWLGLEAVEVEPARCVCRMTVREEMVNGLGVAHGAIVFALADSAFAFACNTHGRVTVSIENSITYPAAIQVGETLTAVAEREAGSRRLGYYRVVVTSQEGRTVALFRGTAYATDHLHPSEAS